MKLDKYIYIIYNINNRFIFLLILANESAAAIWLLSEGFDFWENEGKHQFFIHSEGLSHSYNYLFYQFFSFCLSIKDKISKNFLVFFFDNFLTSFFFFFSFNCYCNYTAAIFDNVLQFCSIQILFVIKFTVIQTLYVAIYFVCATIYRRYFNKKTFFFGQKSSYFQ